MSVQSEIDRIITAVGNAYIKVSGKGGTVPASQTVSNLATAIDSIPAGAGDMLASTYDPQGKAQDIFSYADAKYSKPSGGIPKTDLASDVQTSLGKADSALQSAPVTSVNSKKGAVSLAKGDVGLGNVDNVKQYSASNPPPYPVTSVNGKTGAVTVPSVNVPSTASLLKGNGSGGMVAATRGSDYIASGNIVKQTLVATETTPTENYAINWVYG